MNTIYRLFLVVPCFNEQEVLPETIKQLSELLEELIRDKVISENSGILFINDGSYDKTWEIIEDNYHNNRLVYGLNLARNAGHQNALYAGLMTVKDICDITISIDADLQDDIMVIREMLDKYRKGFDIVYGVRSERKTDTFFKRCSAQMFYRMMKFLGVNTVYNHADYRLMSSRAVCQLGNYKERNLFLRGIVPLIGYNTDTVYYARKERLAGESKYPLKKMLSFAWDGITSFSTKPISIISLLGVIVVIACAIAAIYGLISWQSGNVVSGWTSIFLSIWFLGGVQLISIGIVGQYVGKTYMEVKERPRYNIESFLSHENDTNKIY